MAQQTLSLTKFYKGWGAYQRNLVEIIAPLSPEQLALRAAPRHWSIGMLAQHIVGNRVWWFQKWMGEGSADLAPIAHWDPQDAAESHVCTAAELVAGLQATWRMIEDALDRWTPTDLERVFPPPAALSEEERDIFGELTGQWIIWHVFEHEIHHGGELSLTLGMYDLKAIYE